MYIKTGLETLNKRRHTAVRSPLSRERFEGFFAKGCSPFRNLQGWENLLFYNDRARHIFAARLAMKVAMIGIFSGFGEREFVTLVGRQHVRFEGPVVGFDRVSAFFVVPNNRSAGRDGDGLRGEVKIGDGDGDFFLRLSLQGWFSRRRR